MKNTTYHYEDINQSIINSCIDNEVEELKNCLEYSVQNHIPLNLDQEDGYLSCIAAQKGYLGILKLLKLYNANLRVNDDSVLSTAALNGHEEVVSFLLNDCDADPRKLKGTASYNNYTKIETLFDKYLANKSFDDEKLIRAIKEDNWVEVQPLLQNNPHLIKMTEDGQNILHISARFGHLDLFKHLLFKCPELMLEYDDQGRSPIHLAIYYGQTKFVQSVLMENPALLNQVTKNDQTLLHVSALYGHTELVEWLLKTEFTVRKPDFMNILDQEGWNPLHSAAYTGQQKIVEFLLERNLASENKFDEMTQRGQNVLHIAALYGHVELVKWLYANKPELTKAFDKNGWNPLHSAAYGGEIAVIEWLSKYPEILNQPTQSDQTVLHIAVMYGHAKLVKILVSIPGLINKEDKSGMTALELATKHGKNTIIKLLSQNSTDSTVDSGKFLSEQLKLKEAIVLYEKHKYIDCVKILEEIINTDIPVIGDAYFYKGMSLYHLHKYPSAISCFSKATERHSCSKHTEAYYYKGHSWYLLKNSNGYQKAIEYFDEVIKSNEIKLHAGAYFYKGVLCESLNKLIIAEECFRQTIGLQSGESNFALLEHIDVTKYLKINLIKQGKVEALSELGLNKFDNDGKNALDYAIEHGSTTEFIQKLLELGAKPFQEDELGNSAFSFAIKQRKYDVIKQFMQFSPIFCL